MKKWKVTLLSGEEIVVEAQRWVVTEVGAFFGEDTVEDGCERVKPQHFLRTVSRIEPIPEAPND